WSLGMMMFEMLAGRHPLEVTSAEALLATTIDDAAMPSATDIARDVPELAAIIDGCLRKRMAERIPRATDLVRRLEALVPGRHGRQLGEGESPYPGLAAFQEADADRFFGRARDITRMVAKVRELPITGI